jgi:cyanophycinase-like exopeptidase
MAVDDVSGDRLLNEGLGLAHGRDAIYVAATAPSLNRITVGDAAQRVFVTTI